MQICFLTFHSSYAMLHSLFALHIKSTVQSEQTVAESGHRSDSGILIHGTVVAYTDSWVFLYL